MDASSKQIKGENIITTIIRFVLVSLAGLAGMARVFYQPHESVALLLPGVSLSPAAAAGLILVVFCLWAGLMVLLAKRLPELFRTIAMVMGMESLGFFGLFWLIFIHHTPATDVLFGAVFGLMALTTGVNLLFMRK